MREVANVCAQLVSNVTFCVDAALLEFGRPKRLAEWRPSVFVGIFPSNGSASMPYVYDNPESLDGQDRVGTHQCVALIKHYAKAPAASLWKEGASVKGNMLLKKGTAIATFVNGKYPNQGTGNHAAFYVSQDGAGITVVDQWTGSGTIVMRRLPFLGKDKAGKYRTPSNNGDAFSVVE